MRRLFKFRCGVYSSLGAAFIRIWVRRLFEFKCGVYSNLGAAFIQPWATLGNLGQLWATLSFGVGWRWGLGWGGVLVFGVEVGLGVLGLR